MAETNHPKEGTKCIAVHLPLSLVQKLDAYKAKAGKSKNAILVEFIKQGLTSDKHGGQ